MNDTYYWLTLAISKKDLAEYLGCDEDDIEDQDYLGGIRDFAEIVKLEEIDG